MVSIRRRLLFLQSDLRSKITSFRDEITLKAPHGKWIYKLLCRKPALCLLIVSSMQTDFLINFRL